MKKNNNTARNFEWQNLAGLAFLLLVYTASVIWVIKINSTQKQVESEGRKSVHLVHCIADKRVVDAFRQLGRDYEAMHPDLTVKISAIPKAAYKQWVTTQCVGETVPDIVQAESVWDQMWQSLATRYMIPLSQFVNRPNPYNTQTPLEETEWRNTFLDGMQGGYWRHLTEFYSVPLTTETVRIFYNKNIFTEAAGADEPPKNFHEWMDVCQKISDYAKLQNKTIFPIANSKDIIGEMFDIYYYSLTDGMIDPYDSCYWGAYRNETTLFSLYTNTFTFNQPRVEAPFKICRQIASHSQPGFISNDISQARFLFTQEKAAMTVGKVMDAKVFADTVNFELGIFDFPLPSKDNPEYGQYVVARNSESEQPSIHFCVSRNTKHLDQVIDFLMFCTSVKQNEEFNSSLHWYPCTMYAKPRDYLSVFRPNTEGAGFRSMLLHCASQTTLWFFQNFPLYLTGEYTYDELVKGLEEKWLTAGADDYVLRDENLKKTAVVQSERNVAKAKAKMLFEEAGEFQAGQVMGEKTVYQLALESAQMLEHGITARTYTWHHLQQGKYEFP